VRVSSPSHAIETFIDGSRASVRLARENEILDSDFILCAGLEDDGESRVSIGRDNDMGGFIHIKFIPEIDDAPQDKGKYLYTFLIDVSGSMAGEKLTQAKRAVRIALRNLMEGDCFNIIAFESNFVVFSNKPVRYSQQSLDKADVWADSLRPMGGTEIYKPLEYVLNSMELPKGHQHIMLLFTDGQVGNESEIINLVKDYGKQLALFPFGIDTAVNKYFIDSLADAGNGMSEYIYPGEPLEDKVIR
jgi:Ca-activated chloride channel family protein